MRRHLVMHGDLVGEKVSKDVVGVSMISIESIVSIVVAVSGDFHQLLALFFPNFTASQDELSTHFPGLSSLLVVSIS